VIDWAADPKGNLQSLFCNSHKQCADTLRLEIKDRGMSEANMLQSRFNGSSMFQAAKQLATNHLSLSCGLDSMAHFNKGAVGARLEFVDGVSVAGLTVSDISNTAPEAHAMCQGMPEEDLKVSINQHDPYIGADARGICITVAKNIDLESGVLVEEIQSSNGKSVGIELREATGGMGFKAKVQGVKGKFGSMELALLADEYSKGTYELKKVLPQFV